jgi:hypothetical protein
MAGNDNINEANVRNDLVFEKLETSCEANFTRTPIDSDLRCSYTEKLVNSNGDFLYANRYKY